MSVEFPMLQILFGLFWLYIALNNLVVSASRVDDTEYATTQGEIIRAKMQPTSTYVHMMTSIEDLPFISYSYTVDNRKYLGEIPYQEMKAFGLRRVNKLLDEYPVGKAVDVHYMVVAPERSTLFINQSKLPINKLFALIVGLTGLSLVVSGIIQGIAPLL